MHETADKHRRIRVPLYDRNRSRPTTGLMKLASVEWFGVDRGIGNCCAALIVIRWNDLTLERESKQKKAVFGLTEGNEVNEGRDESGHLSAHF